MKKLTNVQAGRSQFVARIRLVANAIRSFLYFNLRTPWVKRKGMVRIPWDVQLWSPHKDITLGDRVQFGRGCVVKCDLSMGSDVLIAQQVAFIGRDDHTYDQVGSTIWDSPRGDNYKTVVEDDVWIGHGAIIISGVRIGRGSLVAAGSVVSRHVPNYTVVGGIPAKVIRDRFTEDQIREHEKLLAHKYENSND